MADMTDARAVHGDEALYTEEDSGLTGIYSLKEEWTFLRWLIFEHIRGQPAAEKAVSEEIIKYINSGRELKWLEAVKAVEGGGAKNSDYEECEKDVKNMSAELKQRCKNTAESFLTAQKKDMDKYHEEYGKK